jgi:hypothetical protein
MLLENVKETVSSCYLLLGRHIGGHGAHARIYERTAGRMIRSKVTEDWRSHLPMGGATGLSGLEDDFASPHAVWEALLVARVR